jgi:hypothetical protein
MSRNPEVLLAGQAFARKKGTYMPVENWLEQLFGPQPEVSPVAVPQPKLIDAEQVRSMISGEIARIELSRHEWANKAYKANPKQIHLRGDGPSRYETMSIAQINEGRRSKAVESLGETLASLRAMEQMLIGVEGQKRFEQIVHDSIDAAFFPRDGAGGGKPLDLFEVNFLERVGYKSRVGSASSTPLSRMVRELLVVDGVDGEEEASSAFPRQR